MRRFSIMWYVRRKYTPFELFQIVFMFCKLDTTSQSGRRENIMERCNLMTSECSKKEPYKLNEAMQNRESAEGKGIESVTYTHFPRCTCVMYIIIIWIQIVTGKILDINIDSLSWTTRKLLITWKKLFSAVKSSLRLKDRKISYARNHVHMQTQNLYFIDRFQLNLPCYTSNMPLIWHNRHGLWHRSTASYDLHTFGCITLQEDVSRIPPFSLHTSATTRNHGDSFRPRSHACVTTPFHLSNTPTFCGTRRKVSLRFSLVRDGLEPTFIYPFNGPDPWGELWDPSCDRSHSN